MPIFLGIAVAGLALLFGGYRLALRRRQLAQALACGLVILVCGHPVLAARADWEWALFPWPGYAFVQGFVLYALAAAFFGVAAATLPVRWNRLAVLGVGLLVLGHGLRRHAWLAWPESHGEARVPGADHHLPQSSNYTCGPAACAAALSHCGVIATERDLAEACLTRRNGSRLFDLYRGLLLTIGERPLALSIESTSADDIVAGQLVVVAATAGRGHAVCIAAHDGKVTWHDPLQAAARQISLAELRRDFRPPAIVIRRRTPDPAAAPR